MLSVSVSKLGKTGLHQ